MLHNVSASLDMAHDGLAGCNEDIEVSNTMLIHYNTATGNEPVPRACHSMVATDTITGHSDGSEDSEKPVSVHSVFSISYNKITNGGIDEGTDDDLDGSHRGGSLSTIDSCGLDSTDDKNP